MINDILENVESRLSGRMKFYDSSLHGLSHLREMAILAGRIASEAGSDVQSAMVAGFLYDCGAGRHD